MRRVDPKTAVSASLRSVQATPGVLLGILVATTCSLLWGSTVVCAETNAAASESTQVPAVENAASPPKVELGRLLKLPDSYYQPTGIRRGVNRAEWEKRFENVRLDLSSAELALAKAQDELGDAADTSSSWAVAAPGTSPNPENTPLSYKLRQEIRRQREDIERAEHKLRELEIEADLAEVPETWRADEALR